MIVIRSSSDQSDARKSEDLIQRHEECEGSSFSIFLLCQDIKTPGPDNWLTPGHLGLSEFSRYFRHALLVSGVHMKKGLLFCSIKAKRVISEGGMQNKDGNR